MKLLITFTLLLAVANTQQIVNKVPLDEFGRNQSNFLPGAFNKTNFDNVKSDDMSLTYNPKIGVIVSVSNVLINSGDTPYDNSTQSISAWPSSNSLEYRGGAAELNLSFLYQRFPAAGETVTGKGKAKIHVSNILLRVSYTVSSGVLRRTVDSLEFKMDIEVLEAIDDSWSIYGPSLWVVTDLFGDAQNKNRLSNVISAKVSDCLNSFYLSQYNDDANLMAKGFNFKSVIFDVQFTAFQINDNSVVETRNFGIRNQQFNRTSLSANDLNPEWRGHQALFAKSVFNETFLYGLQNDLWNSLLNKSWSIPSFQFFTGDLEFAIPSVNNYFPPNEEVLGACRVLKEAPASFNWLNGSSGLIGFSMNYNCSLSIARNSEVISEFNFTSDFIFQPFINDGLFNLRVSSAKVDENLIRYSSNPKYPIGRLDIANYFVSKGLASLQGELLSFDLPIGSLKNCKLQVRDRFVVMYENL